MAKPGLSGQIGLGLGDAEIIRLGPSHRKAFCGSSGVCDDDDDEWNDEDIKPLS